MQVIKLLKQVGINEISCSPETIVKNLQDDSRYVTKNDLFICGCSNLQDSKLYIDNAIKQGAALVFTFHRNLANNHNIFFYQDIDQLKRKLAPIFYPKIPNNLFAVTGTNGKSSIAHLARQLFSLLGYKTASIGTLGLITNFDDEAISLGLTTPGAIAMHKVLNELKAEQFNNVIIETSSHGLIQQRLHNIQFHSAIFTNFTHEHLDYHHDMESYFKAKMILFEKLLDPNGYAILNKDIEQYVNIKNICDKRDIKVISYGFNNADITVSNYKLNKNNIILDLLAFGKSYSVTCNLIGKFNIYNLLAIIALASNFDDIDKIIELIPQLTPVAGRMQLIENKVIVDFAHSSDALEQLLQACRDHCEGRLLLVFGCGGGRDKQKRKLMGKIASEYADYIIITDDNPRFEDPSLIRQEIISSIKGNWEEIGNREQAIKHAIGLAGKDDLVIIAGKGHEKHQIYGERLVPFDDVLTAKKFL